MSSCLERKPVQRRPICAAAVALCITAGVVSATGCTQQQPAAPVPAPMEIDAAMQRRDWERSAAWYPNGDTLAGVNRFPIRSQGGNPADNDYVNGVLDLGASIAQTIALPFTYLVVPPFAPQVYTGEPIPPTHTGSPSLLPPTRNARYGQVVPAPEDQLQRLQSPEPLPPPVPPREQRRGPLGPGDSEFMSSPPTPEEPD
jgi:hypothetical protein